MLRRINIKEFLDNFDLQFFADAGNLVNTTQNYVNAYNGSATSFSGSNTLAPELKAFYDTELLENTRAELVYAQFGKKQVLPAHHKGEVEWRRFNTFANAEQLTEGVIPTGQKFGLTKVTGNVNQFGTYTTVSDKLELRAYDDIILAATEEMGASAAQTEELLIRDGLLTGTNVLYCDNIDTSTDAVITTPTACSGMYASRNDSTHGFSMLTPSMINKAVSIMKKNKVPAFNGKYYAVVHPSVAFDLRECKGWIEAHKYAAPEQFFNGEIGELHGVRFIETVNAPVLGSSLYQNADGNVTYATFLFGKDAFGIVDPEGGALEMIVHDKDEIGGPLNQFSTIGYKFETNGATILYPERLLRIMSCSSFSATDTAN